MDSQTSKTTETENMPAEVKAAIARQRRRRLMLAILLLLVPILLFIGMAFLLFSAMKGHEALAAFVCIVPFLGAALKAWAGSADSKKGRIDHEKIARETSEHRGEWWPRGHA